MPHLIDSHCHLTYEGLIERIDDVMRNAQAAGVGEMITIATDINDAARALQLARRFSNIHVVAGIHPHQAAKAERGWENLLREIAARSDVRAVGETGLDYHYDFAKRETQQTVFCGHLDIATAKQMPVVIHCREAHRDVLDILAEFPDVPRVVFHCFTGTMAEAKEILNAGYWISLTGVVTFKRSDELRDVARLIPADRLMVETDSPYLSPEPVRSVRPNEPAFVKHTAECIAKARGMQYEDLVTLTHQNTRLFFNLPPNSSAPSAPIT